MKKTTTLYLNYLTKHWNINNTLTVAGISAIALGAQSQNIPLVYDPMSKYAAKGIIQGSNIQQNFADVDGDGDLDLLTSALNTNRNLTLFKNIGSNAVPNYQLVSKTGSVFGQFNNGAFFPDGQNMGYGAITAFADMDGDGKTDLVLSRQLGQGIQLYYKNIGSNTSPQYSLLIGSDNPGLPFSKTADISTASYLNSTFADIDGDTKQDLVYVNNVDYSLNFFKNISTSPGNFNFKPITGTANPFTGISSGTYSTTAFNDADNDGLTDLIVLESSSNNYINFFKNTGANNNPAYVRLSNTSPDNPFSSISFSSFSTLRTGSFVDMDGDGFTDFITNATDNNSFINGFNGLITYKRVITAGKTTFIQQNPTNTPLSPFLASVANYQSLNYLDFDGDGDMDMYQIKNGTDPNNKFYFYKNTGTVVNPSWEEFKGTNTFGINTSNLGDNIQFVDLDKDGLKDGIMYLDANKGNLLYLKNTGSNLAPSFAIYQSSNAMNPFNGLNPSGDLFYPGFADLDNDGLIDMVVSSYQNKPIFFKNTGSATQPGFAKWTTPSVSQPSGLSLVFTQIADIDMDGKPDLLFGTNYGGKLEIFMNTSTISSSPSFAYLPGSANPFYHFQAFDSDERTYPSLADLDGDGDIDLHVIGGYKDDKQSYVFKNSSRNPVPPTVNSITKTLISPAVLLFGAADFGFVKGSYNIVSLKVTTLPANGALFLSGVSLTSSQVIPIASLGNLSYTATITTFTGTDSFSFIAIDDADLQSAPATITIDITGQVVTITGPATTTGLSKSFVSKVSVYPNPFDDQVFVNISEGITGEVSISLNDALGTTLKSASFTKPQGSLAYPFSTEGLPGGLYFIRVSFGDNVEVKKIVK